MMYSTHSIRNYWDLGSAVGVAHTPGAAWRGCLGRELQEAGIFKMLSSSTVLLCWLWDLCLHAGGLHSCLQNVCFMLSGKRGTWKTGKGAKDSVVTPCKSILNSLC